MTKNKLPICPLMSVGTDIDMVCIQDKCAWYVPNIQKCSMYMLAYESLINVSDKQKKN